MTLVLVTGANGFLGSHISEALLDKGYQVRALVRKTSDLTNLKGFPLELVYGDLNNIESLPDAVKGVDIVINNAGLTKTNDSMDFFKVNARGTENILKAISFHNPNLQRFILISSTAACGPAPSATPMKEDCRPAPLTTYGRSKLEAEKAVLYYKDRLSAISIILRPCAVYGPRDKEMLSLFKTVKMGIKPAFGCGENYINYTYAKDLAQAVVLAVKANVSSGSIYFVAEKRAYSYSETGTLISNIFGSRAYDLFIPLPLLSFAGIISEKAALIRKKPSVINREKTLEMRQKYWLFDISKIEQEMGFVSTDFVKGATETITWYREKGWL
jgi:nucleoside-diphosphate-sugar epimerase